MMTSSEQLILTPLFKALSSLEIALKEPKNEFVRDAAIQRFEYTHELCWKMLKRYLQMYADIKEYNIKEIFREGAKQGLISNVDAWFGYHAARSLTTHTYNEITAEETYNVAQQFLVDAKELLENLDAKINATNNE